MPVNYSKYPPNWFTEIRPRILKRAKNKCECCGLHNYSVGRREDGKWIPVGGNLYLDEMGSGLRSKEETSKFVKEYNDLVWDEKVFMIVLTISHTNHDINDNRDENLLALCQKCHLSHDAKFHAQNRKRKLLETNGVIPLFA